MWNHSGLILKEVKIHVPSIYLCLYIAGNSDGLRNNIVITYRIRFFLKFPIIIFHPHFHSQCQHITVYQNFAQNFRPAKPLDWLWGLPSQLLWILSTEVLAAGLWSLSPTTIQVLRLRMGVATSAPDNMWERLPSQGDTKRTNEQFIQVLNVNGRGIRSWKHCHLAAYNVNYAR